MTQQYTCPECKEHYTKFTIHAHYGCGVDPLDAAPVIEAYNLSQLRNTIAPLVEGVVIDLDVALADEPDETIPPSKKKRGLKPKER